MAAFFLYSLNWSFDSNFFTPGQFPDVTLDPGELPDFSFDAGDLSLASLQVGTEATASLFGGALPTAGLIGGVAASLFGGAVPAYSLNPGTMTKINSWSTGTLPTHSRTLVNLAGNLPTVVRTLTWTQVACPR